MRGWRESEGDGGRVRGWRESDGMGHPPHSLSILALMRCCFSTQE